MQDPPVESVVNMDAMENPFCLDWWVAFAGKLRQS
jgi:hypothetical protein